MTEQTMIERVARVGRYFTGRPCRRGHIAERFAGNRECVDCALERSARDPKKAERSKASAQRHRAKRADYQRNRRLLYPDLVREIARRSIERDPDRDRARSRRAKMNRSDAIKAYTRARNASGASKVASKKWRQANRAKIAAKTALRKAARLRATPKWANLSAIAAYYAEARRLTVETGIRHTVDHIVPLQGGTVCGLHVEGNLQILTYSENSRKKNKFTPAMIDAALKE